MRLTSVLLIPFACATLGAQSPAGAHADIDAFNRAFADAARHMDNAALMASGASTTRCGTRRSPRPPRHTKIHRMSTQSTVSPPAGLRIRTASATDAPTIAALGAETFTASFGAQNTPENIAAHLAKSFGRDIQRRELADPAITYLVAELDGRLAGYSMVRDGEAPSCVTGELPVEVRRFYVVHEFHGSGIAQALMDASANDARRRGGRTLWLSVWSLNPRAIRFYHKCRFQDVGAQTFLLGDDPQQDLVLARLL